MTAVTEPVQTASEDTGERRRALIVAALCGLVGHTVILYRPHPEAPRIRLPSKPGSAA